MHFLILLILSTLNMIASLLLLTALNCKNRIIDHNAHNPYPNPAKRQSVLEVFVSFQERIKELYTPPPEVLVPPPPLLNLHNELIQHIATLLPPSSAAALALCSRRLMYIIGTEYWQKCNEQQSEEEKHALLDFLSTDLVDYIHCHRCSKLHKPDFKLNIRKCTMSDIEAGVWWTLFDEFSFVHLQMAMKLHRLGKNPGTHLAFLTRTNDMFQSRTGYAPYIIHEPRIVDNEILFRSQYWLLLPWRYIENASSIERVATHGLGNFKICGHLSFWDHRLARIFTCFCNHLATSTPLCLFCTDLWQCEHCDAEFQMHVKDYGKKGFAFVVTKWANLGPALSPYDKKWTLHLEFRYYQGIRSSNGCIMSRFENCKPSEFTPVLNEAQEIALFQVEIQAV